MLLRAIIQFVLLLMATAEVYAQSQNKIDHSLIVKTFGAYVKEASKDNAESILNLIPEDVDSTCECLGPDQYESFIKSYFELTETLEEKIEERDEYGIRVAIRLYRIADGELSLKLYSIYSVLIEANLEKFLQLLKSEVVFEENLDGIIRSGYHRLSKQGMCEKFDMYRSLLLDYEDSCDYRDEVNFFEERLKFVESEFEC